MITPFFNVWLKLKREHNDSASVIGDIYEVLKAMRPYQRIAITLYFLYILVMIAFSIFTLFAPSLLHACGIGFALFLVLTVVMSRIAIRFHRDVPEFLAGRTAKFSKQLRKEFRKIGLMNSEQIQYVCSEAIRVLERKERIRAAVIRYAVDVVVLVALTAIINLFIALLEHDMPLEMTVILLMSAIAVSVGIVFLVYSIWWACDRFGALPISKLRLFISDLTMAMVDEAGVSSRRRIRKRSRG